jgi:hypothetical protein
MKTIKKKYEKWRKALTDGDSNVNPYYVVSYKYYTSGKVAVLMNFNLTLEKAKAYYDLHYSTVTMQDYPASIDIVNAFEDKSFFEENKSFDFENNHNWH